MVGHVYIHIYMLVEVVGLWSALDVKDKDREDMHIYS